MCVYAERWLFQLSNVIRGSIIRAVGMTDTLSPQTFQELQFFLGRLQYETCHLAPSRPCKPWLRHFQWGVTIKGCTLLTCFVFLSTCLERSNRLVFMPMKTFTQFQSLSLPSSLFPAFFHPLPVTFSPFHPLLFPPHPPCQHCHSFGEPFGVLHTSHH